MKPLQPGVYTVSELETAGVLLVQDGNHGEYRPRPNEFVEGGVAFIRAADMDSGRVHFEKAEGINDTAYNRITKGIGRPGDILLSHKGTVGKLARAGLDAPRFVCSPQTTFWRVLDPEVLDPAYLLCFMDGREFRDQLDSRKGETDMADYVSLTAQRQLRVRIPAMAMQAQIAQIIGAIDDKIESNRKTNHSLEQIARAIFKSWFIDFDPVRAKSEGKKPFGMDEATAALFPSSLEQSALGEIPTGWVTNKVDSIFQLTIGRTPPRKELHWFSESPEHMPWVSIKNMGEAGVFINDTSETLTSEAIERFNVVVVPENTVLMSFKLTVGRVSITSRKMATNEAIAHFVPRKNYDAMAPYFIYCFLGLTNFEQLGSTSSIATAVNSTILREMQILVPEQSVLQAFNKVVGPLFELMRENANASKALVSMRDLLLPRLLSGVLALKEALA